MKSRLLKEDKAMGTLFFGKDSTVKLIKDALENGKLDSNSFHIDLYSIVERDSKILLNSKRLYDVDLRQEMVEENYFDVLKILVSFVENSDKYNENQRSNLFAKISNDNYKTLMKRVCKEEWRKKEVLFEGDEGEYKTRYAPDKNPGVNYHKDIVVEAEDESVDDLRRRRNLCKTLSALWELPYGPDKLMGYVYSIYIHKAYDEKEYDMNRKSGVPAITSEQLQGQTLLEIRKNMEKYLFDLFGRKRLFSKNFFASLDKKLNKLDKEGKRVSTHKFSMSTKDITEYTSRINNKLDDIWEQLNMGNAACM